MTIILNLPEDIAKDLARQGEDLSRIALESLTLEEYRLGRLTEEQIRRMLGFESRFQVHAFLKQHNTYLDYTQADLDQDLATARSLSK
jgi:Uncharacterised protein family (UPF0175)